MIFEYSVILYSDFDFEVRMLITMFTYAHHFSVHTTISTIYYCTDELDLNNLFICTSFCLFGLNFYCFYPSTTRNLSIATHLCDSTRCSRSSNYIYYIYIYIVLGIVECPKRHPSPSIPCF
jgi:accessory gene regulator protein AgrB